MESGRKSKYSEPMDPAVYIRLRKGTADDIRNLAHREDRSYASTLRRVIQVGLGKYPKDKLI
jgi:hypothetical protein